MRTDIKKMIITTVLAAVAIYLLALLYIYTMQDRLIFPSYYSRENSYQIPSDLEFTLNNSKGVELEGFYKKSGSKKLLIWFEGNANNVLEVVGKLDSLQDYDVVGVNYQGYGESKGSPSQEAIFSDAVFLYDTVAPNYEKVYLLGRSLGTGVACYLSSQRAVDGAILVTPYDSIAAIASARYKIFPVTALLKHPFESIKYLSGNKTMFSVLEAESDSVVPNKHSENLIKYISNLTLRERFDSVSHGAITDDMRFMPFVIKSLRSFE